MAKDPNEYISKIVAEGFAISSLKEMSKKIDPSVKKRVIKIFGRFFDLVWWIINPALLLLESLVWVLKKVQLVLGTALSLIVHPISTIGKFWAKAKKVVAKLKSRKIKSSIQRTFKRIINYPKVSNIQCKIGDAYSSGKLVKTNLVKAFEWYKKAAKQGNPRAQNRLGDIYYFGIGTDIKKNRTKGIEWYKKSAEQGYRPAQVILGVAYHYGNGVKKNPTKAIKWYKKAAEQGYFLAKYFLGNVYYEGEGVKQNLSEAYKFYKEAYEQGYQYTQFRLGQICMEHKGEMRNLREAFRWFKKGAERGDSMAQNNLGAMYYKGEGVPKNYIQSYKWFSLAVANGEKDAQKYLNTIAKELTKEQLAEAQKLADEWEPTEEEPITNTSKKRFEVSSPHLIVSGLVIVSLYPFIPEYAEVTKVINHIYCWYDNNLEQITSDIGL